MLVILEGIVMCFVLLITCVVAIANDPVGGVAMNGLPSLNRIAIWIENKSDFENSWAVLTDKNRV